MSRNYEYKGQLFETDKSFKRYGQHVFYNKPYWAAWQNIGGVMTYLFSSDVSLADLRKKIRDHVDNSINQTVKK
jgi:hypothetical protein